MENGRKEIESLCISTETNGNPFNSIEKHIQMKQNQRTPNIIWYHVHMDALRDSHAHVFLFFLTNAERQSLRKYLDSFLFHFCVRAGFDEFHFAVFERWLTNFFSGLFIWHDSIHFFLHLFSESISFLVFKIISVLVCFLNSCPNQQKWLELMKTTMQLNQHDGFNRQ